jgi:hypothetical protein
MTYYLGTLDEFWDILRGSGGSLAQLVSTNLVPIVSHHSLQDSCLYRFTT